MLTCEVFSLVIIFSLAGSFVNNSFWTGSCDECLDELSFLDGILDISCASDRFLFNSLAWIISFFWGFTIPIGEVCLLSMK